MRDIILFHGILQSLADVDAYTLSAIDSELKAHDNHYGVVIENLKKALDIIEDCGRTYRYADEHIKRILNQALFDRIIIEPDGKTTAELAQPFNSILTPIQEIVNRHNCAKNSGHSVVTHQNYLFASIQTRLSKFFSQCLNKEFLVGLSSLDSNKIDVVIKFKKSLPIGVNETNSANNLPSEARKVNEYGEVVAGKMLQKQKWLTDEEVKLLIAEYQSGKSTYELAEQFDCARSTISRHLKKFGVEVADRRGQGKIDEAGAIAMYEDKNTIKVIAEKYSVCPRAITRVLKANSVTIRGRWG